MSSDWCDYHALSQGACFLLCNSRTQMHVHTQGTTLVEGSYTHVMMRGASKGAMELQTLWQRTSQQATLGCIREWVWKGGERMWSRRGEWSGHGRNFVL